MKILVIGSGGREHALAWKLAQSPRAQIIYVAPGNGGTDLHIGHCAIQNFPSSDFNVLAEFCVREGIAFTVVGPDNALASGVVDIFTARGLKIFGPTQAAAQLESSKAFSKAFMQRHNIPTASYATFTEAQAAHAYVEQHGAPIVIKADGLAFGKGVVVATSVQQAHEAIDDMLGGKFGAAGSTLVIESFLQGEEASFFVLSDGKNVLPLATAQDHKRLLDGDEGPNTGGMGAYSPAPIVTPDVHRLVMREIVHPTISGMAAEGNPFVGFLFVGLMIDAQGKPFVVEFNARMGDPETQPIMMRIKNDFVTLMEHGINHSLDKAQVDLDRRVALGVVLAAEGYPEDPRKGDVITGLPDLIHNPQDDLMVFHAGTRKQDDNIVTNGGRVLCVTGMGDSVRMAQKRAYEALESIQFAGVQYRKDIGWRAVQRKSHG